MVGDEWGPREDDACALCSASVLAPANEPVVIWRGGSGRLALHGGCAGSFVLRLARDAWELERDAADGKYPLTKV